MEGAADELRMPRCDGGPDRAGLGGESRNKSITHLEGDYVYFVSTNYPRARLGRREGREGRVEGEGGRRKQG